MVWPGIEPGPPAAMAGTLTTEKEKIMMEKTSVFKGKIHLDLVKANNLSKQYKVKFIVTLGPYWISNKLPFLLLFTKNKF